MRKALLLGILAFGLALAVARPAAAQLNYPHVLITNPTDQSVVGGTVPVTAWVFDPFGGFVQYELWVDGGLYQAFDAARLKTNHLPWDTTELTDGWHTLVVAVFSASGRGESAPVMVNVTNTAGSPGGKGRKGR